MVEFDQELDTSGLHCPMPLVKTKKALKSMQTGQVLHLIATDSGTNDDIPGFVKGLNCEIIESSETGGAYHFYIRKAG